ncbi:MAG: hypothetical protein ACTHK7_21400 [Aureliella sp.]
MKFSILDLLAITSVSAGLLYLARIAPMTFLVAFGCLILVHCCVPFAIVLIHLVMADQHINMLRLKPSRTYERVKKLWLISFVCTLAMAGILYVDDRQIHRFLLFW